MDWQKVIDLVEEKDPKNWKSLGQVKNSKWSFEKKYSTTIELGGNDYGIIVSELKTTFPVKNRIDTTRSYNLSIHDNDDFESPLASVYSVKNPTPFGKENRVEGIYEEVDRYHIEEAKRIEQERIDAEKKAREIKSKRRQEKIESLEDAIDKL